ncbi:38916_t:CDS:2, partial [Gigaspora margarita]
QSKNFSNDFENNKETDKLPASINVTVNTSQTNSTFDNERVNDNQQVENNISRMFEQTIQAGVIGSIQDDEHEDDFVSNDDSPGWSECEDCYENKKKFSGNWYCKECKNLNSKKSKCKMQLEYLSSDKIDNQNTKKKPEDLNQKKKTMNCSKKRKTFSDPLDIIVISKKSTLYNDSAINDSIKNRVESTNFPIVVVKEDERFSSRQRIDETENVSAIQSDNNIRESFTQLDNFRSSTSLHSINFLIDEIEDNTSDEDSRSLQV